VVAIGAVISSYHVLLERYPTLETSVCSVTMPCSFVWFRRLGFVTLPFMALTGFLFIASALALRRPEES